MKKWSAKGRFGFSTNKLLSTTALIAAAAMPTMANAKDVGDYDVWQFQNTQASKTSQGYVEFSGDTIIDNLVQEDIGKMGHVHLNARLTVATGVEAGPMHILGKLTSTGDVKILDVNGFLFGKDSVVDTQGFSAIGGSLKNADSFLTDGKLDIDVSEDATITIENGAMISVGQAGLAAFVAPFISNAGIINAKMGTVTLAAGKTATLDLYGDGLVEVAVDGELSDALIENSGTIAAEGGRVHVTALAAKNAVDNVVNMDGIVTVASATQQGGKIVLSGGDSGVVTVSGTLDASGNTGGGDIEVTGQNVHITDTAEIKANAREDGDGGEALVYADNVAIFEGKLEARGGFASGNGGNAEISAGESVGYYGSTDLSSATGETGTLVIDPEHLTISDAAFSADLAAIFTLGILGNININDQALANTLVNANVNLWASETLSTGSDIDISTGRQVVGITYGGLFSGCFFGCPVYADAITSYDLKIAAPSVSIGHDVILGTGELNVADILTTDSVLGFGFVGPLTDIIVDELNLDGKIYTRNAVGGPTSLALDSQINTTANTINVSNNALIQQAIHFADAADADAEDINLAAQTFTDPSQVVVDRDVNIAGAGKFDTIINPSFDTGSSGNARGWWLVNAGTVLNLSDLTMDGNGQLVWQAIRHQGSGTIDNVLFNDIQFNASGPSYAGTAVAAFGDGTLDVTNSMFTNIGRIGVQYFGAGVSGSTFSNNMYTGKGAGNWLDYGVEVGGGAADIQILDNTITNNLGVAASDGSISSGILVSTFFAPGSGATISGNTLTDNTAGVAVGFDASDSSTVEFGTGNVITGGEHGLIIRGADVDIVGDTLSDIVFGGQSDSFVQLLAGAEFAPGNPTVIDGTGVTWGTFGILPAGADAIAVENMVQHFADTGADGLINFGSIVVNNNGGETTFDGSIQKGVNIAGDNGINTVVIAGSNTNYGGSVEVWANGLKIEGVEYNAEDVTIDVNVADAFSNIGDQNVGLLVANQTRGGGNVTGVNIDPIVFSGSGDGIILGTNASSAIDSTIDGNIFTVTGYGVRVNNVGGTTNIINNDINTGRDAVQINENLSGNTLNITGNSTLQGADDAIEFTTSLLNAIVNINDNGDIIGDGSDQFGDAIDFRGTITNSTVSISGNDLIRSEDDAIQIIGGIRGGSFTIDGNDQIIAKSGNAINLLSLSSFGGNGTAISNGAVVKITNNTIVSNDDNDTNNPGGDGDGILISGSATDTLPTTPNTAVDGAELEISGNDITGFKDGVLLYGAVKNGSTVNIDNNHSIVAGNNGVTFAGPITGSTVSVSGNNDGIDAGNNGVVFASTIDNSDIDVNNNIIMAENTGVLFDGEIKGNSTVDVNNNNIGTALNRVLNGVLFNKITNATVKVAGGNIFSGGGNGPIAGDGINFRQGLHSGAIVEISNIVIDSSSDEAIDVNNTVRSGSEINIFGGLYKGGNNGIEFSAIAGEANIGKVGSSTTINGLGADKRGVNLLGAITGTLNLDTVKVYGTDDAIGSNDDQDNIVNGGTVNVLNSRLGSGLGDGLELGALSNGATVNVENTAIWVEDNGIHFVDGVDASTVNITNSYIAAEGNGILFGTGSPSVTGGSIINITGKHGFFGKTIVAKENGVLFEGLVDGGSTVNIDDAIIQTSNVGVNSTPPGSFNASGVGSPSTVVGDGVRFNGVQNANVNITNSNINATNGNGVFFGAGSPSLDNATVDISSNTIHGSEDGIHFADEILNSRLTIGRADGFGNTITAGSAVVGNGTLHDGIYFGGDISGATRILIGWNNIDSLPTTGNGATGFGDMGIRFDGFVNTTVPGTSGVGIIGNTISGGRGAEDRGISFWNGIGGESTVRIADNTIDAGDDGIGIFDTIGSNQNQSVRDNANVRIQNNTIGNSVTRVGNANSGDGNGIDFQSVTGNSNVEISGNDIWSRKNAVEFDKIVNTTGTIDISDNTNLNASQEEGIQFAAGVTNANVQITDNASIIGGNGNGIFFGKITNAIVNIARNTIQGINGNGISMANGITGSDIDITDNDDIKATANGILIGGELNANTDVNINNNRVREATNGVGIKVADNTFGGVTVNASSNSVWKTGQDGINFDTVSNATLQDNNIGYQNAALVLVPGVDVIGGDGIEVKDSDGAQVLDNNITNTAANGIYNNSSDATTLSGNDITNVNLNGILVNPSIGVTVSENEIDHTGQHGIFLTTGSHNAIVHDNELAAIGLAGTFDGIHAENSNDLEITENEILASTTNLGATGHGIFVSGGTSALIEDNLLRGANGVNGANGKSGAGLDGIHVVSNAGVEIMENTIRGGNAFGSLFGTDRNGGNGADQYGIFVSNSANADVKGNDVIGGNGSILGGNRGKSVGLDGIRVTGSNGSEINDNTVNYAGGHGIYLNPSHNSVIDNNDINDVALNGINVLSSNNVDVTNNRLHAIGQNGIYAENSNTLDVIGNIIGNGITFGANDDGINVNGGRNANIDDNTIRGGLLASPGAGRDGIHVVNNREAVITNNTIQGGLALANGAVRHGIYAENSGAQGTFNTRDGVRITGNTITNGGISGGAGEDGIHVLNSAGGLFGDRALIEGNTVNVVGDDGIFVDNTSGIRVLTNTVSLTGNHGIRVENSDIVEINTNTVTGTAGDGIELFDSNGFEISGNILSVDGANGILATDVTLGSIDNNTISAAVLNGISLVNGNLVSIDTNTITGTGQNGVSVVDSNAVEIINNNISLAGANGIFVDPSSLIDISGNTITGTLLDGIYALDVFVLNIDNNTVTLAGQDGIDVDNAQLVTVTNNTVAGTAGDGVKLNDVVAGTVDNNTILGVVDNGIEVTSSELIGITNNTTALTGNDGIHVDGVLGLDVSGNLVTLAGDDGIDADDMLGFIIAGNIVGGSADNGIQLSDAALGSVNNNFVILSGDDGIDADNIAGVGINGNNVLLSGDDGIDVNNALFSTVNGNTIALSGNNGIEAEDVAFFTVSGNNVTLSGNDGIHVEDALLSRINGNVVTLSADDGIDLESSVLTSIDNNVTLFSLSNGIEVENSALINISDNFAAFSGNAGIYVDPSFFINVSGNTAVFNTVGIEFDQTFFSTINNNNVAFNLVGISVEDSAFIDVSNNNVGLNLIGIYLGNTAFATINNNNIAFNGLGVNVDGSDFIDISSNTINSNLVGVRLEDVNNVNILDNDIANNLFYGLWADGPNNGNITLAGNVFTDNLVGARFESGAIDISDLANPNSFIFTPGYVAPFGAPVVGMQFDGDPNNLTIVGETLGATIFEGFSSRPINTAFYVRFENGSILDPISGLPIIIDGTQASFDGLIPANQGNILTPAQLASIEGRLFDADDAVVNGRGQIFVGIVPPPAISALTIDNVEDFFNQFTLFDGDLSGINLTILGLPPVNLPPGNIADITPFAGEDDEALANIEPAAGEFGDPTVLANIQPAAGPNGTPPTWGEIMNAAVNGPVNYSFTTDNPFGN